MKKYLAEMVGTAILVIGGCGAAILSGQYIGVFGIAMAFGLSLLVIAYTIGNVSGGHVNPAVTLGLALANKFPKSQVLPYVISQIIGGVIGASVVWVMNGMTTNKLVDAAGNIKASFAGNILMPDVSIVSGMAAEIVLTSLLVMAVLFTTHNKFPNGLGGLLVGSVLALIHIISIPITNTSVNPARSIAVAFFEGGSAITNLWIFILSPLLGAVLAVIIYRLVVSNKELD